MSVYGRVSRQTYLDVDLFATFRLDGGVRGGLGVRFVGHYMIVEERGERNESEWVAGSGAKVGCGKQLKVIIFVGNLSEETSQPEGM